MNARMKPDSTEITALMKQRAIDAAGAAADAAAEASGQPGRALVAAELVDDTDHPIVVPPPTDVLTIEPKVYVAAVFQPFQDRLAEAKAEAAAAKYDIKTSKGMDEAVRLRALFRQVRLDAENTRVERKAPFLAIGKLLDSTNKKIAEAVAPHEERYDAEIAAEEARKNAAKEAAKAAELARTAAIEKKVAQIRSAPVLAVGQSAAKVRELIERLSACVIDEAGYGDYVQIASDAKAASLVALEAAHGAQLQAERDRAELEQLRRERGVAAQQVASPGARQSVPPPPAFDEPAPAPAAAPARSNGASVGVAGAARTTSPIDALASCYAVLMGTSEDRAGALGKAEAVLRAYGRL